MPTVRWLLKILLNPGWAPLTVVILHVALAEFGLTDRYDHQLHFLGGAAIAYFLFQFLAIPPLSSTFASNPVRFPLAFTSACSVALLWEFAEFTSDRFMHTSIQQSLNETMLDLLFGVAGASLVLFAAATAQVVFSRIAQPSKSQ